MLLLKLILSATLLVIAYAQDNSQFMIKGRSGEMGFRLNLSSISSDGRAWTGRVEYFGDVITWRERGGEGVSMLRLERDNGSSFLECPLTKGEWMTFEWTLNEQQLRCQFWVAGRNTTRPSARWTLRDEQMPTNAPELFTARLHVGTVDVCIRNMKIGLDSVNCNDPGGYPENFFVNNQTKCGCPGLPSTAPPPPPSPLAEEGDFGTASTTDAFLTAAEVGGTFVATSGKPISTKASTIPALPTTGTTRSVRGSTSPASKRTKRQSATSGGSTEPTSGSFTPAQTETASAGTEATSESGSTAAESTAAESTPTAGTPTSSAVETSATTATAETAAKETTQPPTEPKTETSTTAPATVAATTVPPTVAQTTQETTEAEAETTVQTTEPPATTNATESSTTSTSTTSTTTTSVTTTTKVTPPVTVSDRSTTPIGPPGTTPTPAATTALPANQCLGKPVCVHGVCDRNDNECNCDNEAGNTWYGPNCNVRSVCKTVDPCFNGGVCEEESEYDSVSSAPVNATFICRCTSGWSGATCAAKVMTGGEIAAVVICILLFLAVLVAGFYLFRFVRRSRKLKGKYNPAKEEMASGNGAPMPMVPINREERLI